MLQRYFQNYFSVVDVHILHVILIVDEYATLLYDYF